MPTAFPGISISLAVNLMQKQDQIIRAFPEVESVFGSVGRSASATDNAPLQRQRHRFDRSSRVVANPVLNGLHHEYNLLADAA
jgi:hypothetical protein